MAHQQSGSSTNILAIIVVAVLAFAGGFLVKGLSGGPSDGGDSASAESGDKTGGAAKMGDSKLADSDKIPVGNSPVLGPENAPVTVVEFSDFQCPFCDKGAKRLKELRKNYPKDVRVVFKHFPLPFHKEAKAASRAAMAAGEQGKFWEMHDKLFAKQKSYQGGKMKELTAGWAKELGLDVEQFKKDFDKEAYGKQIDKDMALGKELGVRGTPHFFINGTKLSGAQPYSKFESVFKDKLSEAKEMLQGGTAKADLYKKAVAKNYGKAPEPSADQQKPQKKKTKVSMVEVHEDDPVAGAKEDYLVTIVTFSDFECPFCDKLTPTINKIKENYDDQVRLVFKQRPLGFHKQAEPAGKASLAAHKQGKFWEYHDKLFANQKKLGEDFYVKAAKDLGLNVDKFNSDRQSDAVQKQLQRDVQQAGKVGAQGTPTSFINGVKLVGAVPYSAFSSKIDAQIEKAKSIKKEKGLSGDKLYEAVVKANKEEMGGSDGGGQPNQPKPSPKVDMGALEIGDSPVKGPKDAPVTMYEFSEFECPFCAKANSTLQNVLPDYEGKIRVVYKHFPLPFHKQAKPAAYASIAAQKQGKFWEYNKLLFKNQKKLGQDGLYTDLAKQLGLNVSKFDKDMKAAANSSQVQDDMAMGKKVGVRGTPHFIINGTKVSGAQPASKFRSVIDQALKEAK